MVKNANIWNLLVASELVSAEKVTEIRAHCEEELGESPAQEPDLILKWLRDNKRISDYQMQVLAEDCPGPFRFAQYQVHAKLASHAFKARHLASNHPVILCFVGGADPAAAKTWTQVRDSANRAAQVKSPFISRCYDVVETDGYRFVAFEDQPGRYLEAKLPPKARLPWPQSLQAIELLTLGLAEIHANQSYHGQINPESIWLQRNGICQLQWKFPGLNLESPPEPELAKIRQRFQPPAARESDPRLADIPTGQRADLFALGGVFFRMISGKPPRLKSTDAKNRQAEIEKHLEYCQRFELPQPVLQLMTLLMNADVSQELKDAEVTAKLAGTILGSQSIKMDVDPALPTLAAFDEYLDQKNRSQGFLNTLETLGETPIVGAQPAHSPASGAATGIITAGPKLSAREQLSQRKRKNQNRLPLIFGVVILLAAVLIGGGLGGLFSANPQQADVVPNETAAKAPAATAVDPEQASQTPDETAPKDTAFQPQLVVENNSEVVWESPTGALPLDIGLMPAAPDFIFALRPQRLQENPQAQLLLRALGPQLPALAKSLTALTGIPLTEIERLVISLHVKQVGKYEAVALVELADPITQEQLWEQLGKPKVEDDAEQGLRKFELDQYTIYFEPTGEETITTFGFGTRDFLAQSLDSLGPLVAGRGVGKLVDRSDRDRDITVIFRKAALLSEEGRWLFAGTPAELRRPLDLFLDDRMEAIKISLHFDQGSYWEWMSEQTTEMSNQELREWLPENLASFRDEITTHVSQIPTHPYWSKVQQQFDNMIVELVREVRVSIEPGGVVANCWLPESAPHNLVAAGELVMNGPMFSSSTADVTEGPADLTALLNTPRDLVVTSDPDLINLLRDIEQEVRDDFPNLPFDFRIRLLGNDLAIAGITQNQRPGKVDIKQKPLGDILAQIMLQANPDKSATSPADPNCKLIYIIGDDPDDPTQKAVLVTTREAAENRKQPLPVVFQTGE